MKRRLLQILDPLLLPLLVIASCTLGIFIHTLFIYEEKEPVSVDFSEWLEEDKTDSLSFVKNEFSCVEFSKELVSNARKVGIDADMAVLHYGGATCHAVVAFKVKNRLVFIEPQTDKVKGYIDVGKDGFSSIEIEDDKK